ncbi:hypothetical protein F5Y17DRAFT_413395 [Xylariaceae sp. FL0594]|nr:hypothetical protein F5Y17DRAFT_413395 [Xylariaceae sp. FL0594]
MPDMSQLAHDRGASHELAHPISSQRQAMSGNHGPTCDSSNSDSQATTSTSNDIDRVFTPTGSDSEGSNHNGNSHVSSQESQLIQLSNLAALQQKIDVSRDDPDISGSQSRKRMADGFVKHTRSHSNVSPVRMTHSRNTSTISVASTAASRISELSAELKAKLSYAMVKVNNGWQSHSIDEVESLASQAASPASSTSTLHGRHGSSASPRLSITGFRQAASNPSSMTTSPTVRHPQGPHARMYEASWMDRDGPSKVPSAASPASQGPSLAPPAPIQPRQSVSTYSRRNSNAKYAPAYMSQPHPHHTSPHTPAQPSPLQPSPIQHSVRAPNADPILFSPPQTAREQEALETLMFMGSPGNSANLKQLFSPQASQMRNGMRTALPSFRLGQSNELSSQGRKALPTGRLQTQQTKRVDFEKSPGSFGELERSDPYTSAEVRGMPRRRTINGSVPRPVLTVPMGLSGPGRTKPPLGDADVQRMIDIAAAADSSDSEGEIQLPPSSRRSGTGVGA